MNESLPTVTVLIPARPGQAEIKALAAARALEYPADRLDIIVARGKQPSVQRNAAMKAARGELIYFLDDDSVPPPGNLRRAVAKPANCMPGAANSNQAENGWPTSIKVRFRSRIPVKTVLPAWRP